MVMFMKYVYTFAYTNPQLSHIPTGRVCLFTIKLIRKVFARKLVRITQRTWEDIEAEAEAIKKVCGKGCHPHIVEVLRIGELRNSSDYFIDMELCDLNLANYIYGENSADGLPFYNKAATPPLRALQIWNIMSHIAKGAKYMHSIDMVHRDLKPANGKIF